MTKAESKQSLNEARELYRDYFSSLPFEMRKKLACPFDRLNEIRMAISKGDSLNMDYLKQRAKELEKWMLEWYEEQK